VVLFTIPALHSVNPVTTFNDTPVKTTQVSQSGHVVLFDEAHCDLGSETMTPGNASFFAWILEEHGFETEMNFDQQLDSGILTGVDILILFFPMVALSAAEVTAVNNFVQAGGGLLLVGVDNNPTWQFYPNNLNALSQTYGITFNTDSSDSWIAIADDMIAHQITQDVSSIHSNLDFKLRGTTLTVESPATTVIEQGGEPVVAVSEYGSGRVVCVGALAPFIMYRTLKQWQIEKDDFFQFSLNIADWLVGISPRKVTVPETAIIPVGSGPALTPTEIEDYRSYNGIIHEHTSHSDGSDSPADMLWAGVSRGLDYIVMTDHSYEIPNPLGLGGITGGLAMREIAEANDLDIEIFIGAELSRGHHSTAFPLTENVYTNTQSGMVDGAHAQGAMIAFCHPTISANYLETYELYDTYGYDAIEVDNSGYTHGLLDEGYSRNFYGASDEHVFETMGRITNVVFVDQPSGPDGRLADVDVVDAILNKRVVILDKIIGLVYGQQVWIDRYLELMDLAETEITGAAAIVEASDGEGTTLAELYLEDAEIAFQYFSARRAMYAAANASTPEALEIAINVTAPDPRFLYEGEYNLTLNITNGYSDAIQFNMSKYNFRALTSSFAGEMIALPSNGFTLVETNFSTPLDGYLAMVFNLKEFNTTSNLSPVIYGWGGLVNPGYHSSAFTTEVGYTGTNVTMVFPIARGDIRYLTSATGFYDDGSGWQNKSASIRTVTIEGTIGPYPKDTVISIYFIAYDMFGGEFVSPVVQYTVTTDPLEPTTTTTTAGPPIEIDPVLLMAAAGGAIAVIVVVVVLMKRKK
jgi:hypothetical protein